MPNFEKFENIIPLKDIETIAQEAGVALQKKSPTPKNGKDTTDNNPQNSKDNIDTVSYPKKKFEDFLKRMRARIQQYRENNTALREAHAKAQAQNAALLGTIKAADEHAQKLESKIKAVQDEYKRLEEEMNTTDEEEQKRIHEREEELQQRIRILEKELQTERDSLTQTRTAAKIREDDLMAALQHAQENIKSVENELTQLQANEAEGKAEQERVSALVVDMENRLARLKLDEQTALETISELRQQVQALSKTEGVLARELESLKAVAMDEKEEVRDKSKLEKEIANKDKELARLREELNNAHAANETLVQAQQELEATLRAHEHIRPQVGTLLARVAQFANAINTNLKLNNHTSAANAAEFTRQLLESFQRDILRAGEETDPSTAYAFSETHALLQKYDAQVTPSAKEEQSHTHDNAAEN